MFFTRQFAIPVAALAALLMLAACDDDDSIADPVGNSAALLVGNIDPESDEGEVAIRVHGSTARFHSIVQATRFGYVNTGECVASPDGGMGFHWVNESLIDDEFDPRRPEALLYEMKPNGRPRLIAVEYIVLNEGQDAPVFGNQLFDEGGTPVEEDHWSLHVWLFKENPAGPFAPFNPNVSCN